MLANTLKTLINESKEITFYINNDKYTTCKMFDLYF